MCQVGRKIIAEKIKQFRVKMGLNKEELSLKLNMDNSYISKLERERINITIDRLEEICKILNIELKDIFS